MQKCSPMMSRMSHNLDNHSSPRGRQNILGGSAGQAPAAGGKGAARRSLCQGSFCTQRQALKAPWGWSGGGKDDREAAGTRDHRQRWPHSFRGRDRLGRLVRPERLRHQPCRLLQASQVPGTTGAARLNGTGLSLCTSSSPSLTEQERDGLWIPLLLSHRQRSSLLVQSPHGPNPKPQIQ